MIFLELFTSFFKIGLFSFGGGYAMIQLISEEISNHAWLAQSEFIQIIGIAEMTPGPIAVNSATFVGYKAAGILGAICATVGVALPSLIIIMLLATLLFKNASHPLMREVFKGIKPVVAGLVLAAVITVSKSTLITETSSQNWSINYQTLIIGLIILFLDVRTEIHPILLIVISGVLGYGLYFLPV